MAHPCFVDGRGAIGDHLHQVDAPARRIHLLVPQHVGGAHGQAEAAVHAFVDQFVRRRVVRVVPVCACWMEFVAAPLDTLDEPTGIQRAPRV